MLLVLALLLSENRKAINLRTVSLALLIQTCFAGIVLYVPLGKTVLAAVSGWAQHVINYANSGLAFVFGDLANYKLGFIFAINVLPILIFFSALMSVLYYLGIMQWIIGFLAVLLVAYWAPVGSNRLLRPERSSSVRLKRRCWCDPILQDCPDQNYSL